MRILIVSDTHGSRKNLDTILENVGAIDMFIHLGDLEGGEKYIQAAVDCEKHMIRGNNDFFSELEKEEEFFLGRYKVLICHGHYYYVSMNTERIKEEARARGVNIVMFGHTHKPLLEIESDMIVLNPGSVSFPRQEGRRGSFILMELDEKGEAHFTINYL